jgi:hypothetical protein
MTETPKSRDPVATARARRRLGFVAMLWWIAALAGTLGLIQRLQASWVRVLFVSISWVLAMFFSYAWWEVRKGHLPE